MALLSSALLFSLSVAGCSNETSSENSSSEISANKNSEENSSTTSLLSNSSYTNQDFSFVNDLFSDRDLSTTYEDAIATIELNKNSVVIDGDGAVADGSKITITDEGVYVISGTLDDGQIVVDSDKKVQIILDNADITCLNSAPIYIKNADKTFITLADNSENSLVDGSTYDYLDDTENEPDATIFSKDNLTINGTGILNITANFNEGITSKDEIVIANCVVNITSVGNGIKGKDYVAVDNATININTSADGIKSTNAETIDENNPLGFVYIHSGEINIASAEDGIQAESYFIADNGDFNITTGGGASNAEPHQGDDFGNIGGHWGGFEESTTEETDDSTSAKGIKATIAAYINSGLFNIDSSDDAIHSNGYVNISNGEITLSSGDDGIHADSLIDINNGTVNITQSYEGLESAVINIDGGSVEINSSDDGVNASDGTSQGAMGNYSNGVEFNITGGFVYVNADGDGLDSNGDMTISGGTVIVDGPTNSGNGALDGNNEILCNGGVLVAAGSSGMAENPTNNSNQRSVSITLDSTQQADTLITICDSNGDEILSYAPSKSFNSIIFSSPDIIESETYTVYSNGTTSSTSQFYGLYENNGYNNDGTEVGTFTSDDITSFLGTQGGMMGGNGFGGGRGNGGNFEMPTDESGTPQMPNGDFGGGRQEDFQMTTDENGNPQMPNGNFGGGRQEDFQMTTDEKGNPQPPESNFGGQPGGFEPPTDESGNFAMPENFS